MPRGCSAWPVTEPGGPRASTAHGGWLLAALLAGHGVRHVFGVPGGQTLALYDGILDHEPGLRHVQVRDERSAAYAADAYARVTGQAGVCDATVGPGAAKLPSGLAEALGASVPVLALVSDLPARLAPHRYRSAASQALDQAALLAAGHQVAGHRAGRGRLARAGPARVPGGDDRPPGPGRAVPPAGRPGRPAPARSRRGRLRRAGEAGGAGRASGSAGSPRSARCPTRRMWRPPPPCCAGPRSPFLLAGGGVLHSGAEGELVALAERLSAAVGTTLVRQGVIAEDHPLSVGVTGSMGTAAAAAALAEADVVLLAGSKAGGGATFGWTLPRRDQVVVQLDLDPAELGRAFPLAAAAARRRPAGPAGAGRGPGGALTARPARPDRRTGRRGGRGSPRSTAAWRADRDRERASDAVPIAPQRVLAELEAALGPDDSLICDASLASGWGGVYLEQRSSRGGGCSARAARQAWGTRCPPRSGWRPPVPPPAWSCSAATAPSVTRRASWPRSPSRPCRSRSSC